GLSRSRPTPAYPLIHRYPQKKKNQKENRLLRRLSCVSQVREVSYKAGFAEVGPLRAELPDLSSLRSPNRLEKGGKKGDAALISKADRLEPIPALLK
ncbi:MAG TPA: hypothetical protein VMZ06_05190, partial [Candidatus Bathyarchaeia archaeon]|nr:hypothetical protein [Candidatus Bathyarchaeia archaeon]